jgi:hypothetical protein
VDLFDVARACIRRWYVVLPLLLIVAWYSHNMYQSVKPVYYSNATIGMVAPNTKMWSAPQGVEMPQNGLLEMGGPSLMANMAAVGLKDPTVVTKVVAAGGTANYTSSMFWVPATSPQLPMVTIAATEPDPAVALKTVELVLEQANSTLHTLQQQAGVPDSQMVKSFVVSPPSEPASAMPSRTKSTIAVFAAGVGITILVGLLVDVLLMRWKRRRQKRRQTRVQAADGADTADGARNVDPQNKYAADEVALDTR